MKNIFDVDSNEIKRILSLHEESTKKQYLNVLNEVDTLDQSIDKLKTSAKNNTNPVQDPDALSSYTTVGKNGLENVQANQQDLEFYSGTKFTKKMSKSNKPYVVSQTVNVKFKADTFEVFDGSSAKGKIIYWCTGSIAGKYQWSASDPNLQQRKKDLWYDDGDLTQALNRVCKYVLPKSVTKPEDNKTKVNKQTNTKQKVNTQTFSTQNTEFTKQIQTSLGTTSTGQVTDSDLDQILQKLKQ